MFQGLSLPDNPVLIASVIGAAALAALVFVVVWRRRLSAADLERRRRLQVHASGRAADGTVTDVRRLERDGDAETLIYYKYVVGGVEYSAAQDVSTLLDEIGDPALFLGPATVKYSSRIPSNSIVVCEEWSGLRRSSKPLREGV